LLSARANPLDDPSDNMRERAITAIPATWPYPVCVLGSCFSHLSTGYGNLRGRGVVEVLVDPFLQEETLDHRGRGLNQAANRALLVLLLLAVTVPQAGAALGEDFSSVQADQHHVKGTLRTASGPGYLVHEIETPAGTRLREFASPAGSVFAVAWEGPFLPDLRQLMGAYHGLYARAAQKKPSGRGPLRLQLPGLTFESAGHPRSFHGRAWIPELMPAGMEASEIQ